MFLSNLNPFVSLIVGLIYLGVIVILFFFILLIINLQQTIRDNLHLKKISLISLSLFFFNLFFFILLKRLGFLSYKVNINFNLESFESLGLVLFNDFSVIIIILGLILFLGLISIVLLLVKPSSLKLNNSGRVSK
jgi:NADH:ubiquinone oxidoreductase subunit 6 (subunit J)